MCAQLCPTLCNPMDCSPPGSSVHEILQARVLERVAISSSKGSSQPRDWTHISWVSCIAGRLFTTEPQGSPNKNVTTHVKVLYMWTYILILGKTHNHHSLSLSTPPLPHTHTPHSMKCYFEETWTFQWTITFYGNWYIYNSRTTHLHC